MLFEICREIVSVGLKHLREHGDGSGAWEGVYLIQIDFAVIQKEINS